MSKKYPSITTPGVEHAGPQYITEIIVFRQERLNNRRLPPHWWRGKTDLAKRFRQQLFWVRSFLKVNDEEATILALNSAEGKNIFSLKAPQLDELVAKQKAKLDKLKEVAENVTPEVGERDKTVRRQQVKNDNVLDKLRELDE